MSDVRAADLGAMAGELLERAAESPNGRATRVVHGAPDVGLSQILLAIREGRELAEHANPGEATLQVLSGRVRFTAGEDVLRVDIGELVVIPHGRHAVFAEQDFVGLLTVVVKGGKAGTDRTE